MYVQVHVIEDTYRVSLREEEIRLVEGKVFPSKHFSQSDFD